MQGHLRNSHLVVEIKTTCAQSGEMMEFVVDSDLNHQIAQGGPSPLVFEPDIDWSEFKDSNIIDGY